MAEAVEKTLFSKFRKRGVKISSPGPLIGKIIPSGEKNWVVDVHIKI